MSVARKGFVLIVEKKSGRPIPNEDHLCALGHVKNSSYTVDLEGSVYVQD